MRRKTTNLSLEMCGVSRVMIRINFNPKRFLHLQDFSIILREKLFHLYFDGSIIGARFLTTVREKPIQWITSHRLNAIFLN